MAAIIEKELSGNHLSGNLAQFNQARVKLVGLESSMTKRYSDVSTDRKHEVLAKQRRFSSN